MIRFPRRLPQVNASDLPPSCAGIGINIFNPFSFCSDTATPKYSACEEESSDVFYTGSGNSTCEDGFKQVPLAGTYPTGPLNYCCQSAGIFCNPDCPQISDAVAPELVFVYVYLSIMALAFAVFFAAKRLNPTILGGSKRRGEFAPTRRASPPTGKSLEMCDTSTITSPLGSAAGDPELAQLDLETAGEEKKGDRNLGGRRSSFSLGLDDSPLESWAFLEPPLARLCVAMLFGFYFLFIYFYIRIIVDYYYGCQVNGIDNQCFYGDYRTFGNCASPAP